MAQTPLMIQYREMKKQHSDTVLFFRVGDFYEMFDEDAVEISSLLNLTLTHKGDDPMCGIPFHAARNYIKRLLDAGKKIAICEQTELSDSSKSLAKREVVRIITPATVVDEDFLDDKSFNYILSVFRTSCSFCDVSTGDFHVKNLDPLNKVQSLRSIIEQVSPKEILVCEDEYFIDEDFKLAIDGSRAMVTKLPPWYFTVKTCYKILCEQAGVQSLDAFGFEENDKLCSSAGSLIKYIQETSKTSVSYLTNFVIDNEENFVSLDESSRKNLELFNNLYDGSSRFSLFDTINRCRTSSGTRLLKNWISFPLRNIDQIKERQSWVKYFIDNPEFLKTSRQTISNALDLNRLVTRVLLKRSVPHDLNAIKQSIASFFSIVENESEKLSQLFEPSLFEDDNLQKAVDLMTEIGKAINPDTLGQYNEGEVIVDGYDDILDERRRLQNNSDGILRDYLEEEKSKTGLSILKLGYNRVFGYYLEIPNGQLNKAPDYFLRKQTLVNGERFTTEKLQTFEKEIITSKIKAEERERELYQILLDKAASISPVLNSMGHFISIIDVYQSLATLAIDSSFVMPEMVSKDVLEIIKGRHPVVEKQVGPGKFVSNDLDMNKRFVLITGPNMAGKSTYLRQNALIILLAHIGSYVPALKAKIGIVDKIFCRVGAMDNLARGQSTFLLEMQEAAFILRNCTERSFVIVDEIGRGTSTQDGMSLAYAMMKYLIKTDSKTLFATHYHELTMVDTSDIRLLTLEVDENKGNVTFIRKIKEGVAASSYGIHVAKLAGVPSEVIKAAKQFQQKHFEDYSMPQTLFTSGEVIKEEIIDPAYSKIIDDVKNLDLDQLTPMQSMLFLSKLKEEVQNLE